MEQYLELEDAADAEDRMDTLPPSRWADVSLPPPRTQRHGSRSVRARLRSRVALGSGDLATAASSAEEALTEAMSYPKPEAEWLARLQVARVRLAQGDAPGAQLALAPLVALAQQGWLRLDLESALVRADAIPPGPARSEALRAVARRASTLGFRRIARLAQLRRGFEPPGSDGHG